MSSSYKIKIPVGNIQLKIGTLEYPENVVDRIAGIFQKMWSRIPTEDAEIISEYWSKDHGDHSPHVWIEISSSKAEGSLADCRLCGSEIRLYWRSMGELPDECIADLLSHELAHVYQWATGRDRSQLKKTDLKQSLKDLFYPFIKDQWVVEVHADEVATRWGFDVHSCGEWILRTAEPGKSEKWYRKEAMSRRWVTYCH